MYHPGEVAKRATGYYAGTNPQAWPYETQSHGTVRLSIGGRINDDHSYTMVAMYGNGFQDVNHSEKKDAALTWWVYQAFPRLSKVQDMDLKKTTIHVNVK